MRRVASVTTINRLTQHQVGEEDSRDYRVHALDHNAERISLWHEVPLFAVADDGKLTGALNFICEIPKYTRRKFEISTKEAGNPIKQDEKNGKLRVFAKGDIFFNYGCFPRTWEDPRYVSPDVGCGGDNDPLDVCEIGLKQIPTGMVRQVKILGILCLIDDGEADWKVIAIDTEDRWAPELNDVHDVERLLPGTLECIREWFRTYKIPDGKPPNKFGLGERFMDVAYSMKVIKETHKSWKALVSTRTHTTPPTDTQHTHAHGCVATQTHTPAPSAAEADKLVSQLSVSLYHDLDLTTDRQAASVLLSPYTPTPRIKEEGSAFKDGWVLGGLDIDGEDMPGVPSAVVLPPRAPAHA